jgi:dsDNA-specific endonuclease/ATPase MutS2
MNGTKRFTAESFARTLTVLGRQLAERQDEINYNGEQARETGGDKDAEVYDLVGNRLEDALDALDEAIAALTPGDLEVPE